MRVINFRGKKIVGYDEQLNPILGDFVYGDLLRMWGDSADEERFAIRDFRYILHEVATETVGQHTGFIVSGDQGLYEGDIVQKHDCYDGEKAYTMTSSVVYDETGFYLKKISGSPKTNNGGLFGFPSSPQSLEIIGNIHDNGGQL